MALDTNQATVDGLELAKKENFSKEGGEMPRHGIDFSANASHLYMQASDPTKGIYLGPDEAQYIGHMLLSWAKRKKG